MIREFIKKWIFVLILLIFNLFISIRSASGVFYLFFWFLCAFVLINLAWVSLQYFSAKLTLERMHAPLADITDRIKIKTLVKNSGFLPLYNFVLEDHLGFCEGEQKRQRVLVGYLGPKSSLQIEYQGKCFMRGRYDIGAFTVYFFDPFHLFFFRREYKTYSEIYVFPRIFKIRKFPPLVKGILPWFGIQTTHISGDDDEFYGIREYKEGDPIKRIHWVSTARNNKLIVKQFQRQTYYRVSIMFNLEKDRDFGQGTEKISEYIISIAASISKYLLDQNVSVEIIANVGQLIHIPANKGPEHLTQIMKFLTVASAESRISLGEMFEDYASHIPNDSSLVVIMMDKDWEHLPKIRILENKNVSLVPLILISSTFISDFEKKALVEDVKIKISRALNFYPIVFSRGDNLEQAFLRD